MRPLLLALAILAVGAPLAYAAKFRGHSEQNRRAAVITRDGQPARITLHWRAECGMGHVIDDTTFLSPFKEGSASFVRDGGSYTTRIHDEDGKAFRLRVNARVRAHRLSADEWRGRFRADSEVRRNDKLITRCHTGRIRWSAKR